MEKFLKFFKQSDKRVKIIFISGVLGIVFIFFSQFFPSDTKEKNEPQNTDYTYEYKEDLEKSLENFVSKMEGAGKTKVLVTLDKSGETLFLKESQNDINQSGEFSSENYSKSVASSEKYVIVDGKDGRNTVVKSRTVPEIKGVLIICEGGDNSHIKAEVLNAVTTVLDLNSNRVYISKLANY